MSYAFEQKCPRCGTQFRVAGLFRGTRMLGKDEPKDPAVTCPGCLAVFAAESRDVEHSYPDDPTTSRGE